MENFTPEQLELAKNFSQNQRDMYNQARKGGATPEVAFNSALILGGDKPQLTLGQKALGVADTVAQEIGGRELAVGIGQLGASGRTFEMQEQALEQGRTTANALIERIREAREAGDTERVERLSSALGTVDYGEGLEQDFVTNREVVGSAVKLAGSAVGAFAGDKLARGLIAGGTKPLQVGLRAGGVEGAIYGVGRGTGDAIADGKGVGGTAVQALQQGLLFGGLGAGGGAVVGGALQAFPVVAGKVATTADDISKIVTNKSQHLKDLFKRVRGTLPPDPPTGNVKIIASQIPTEDIVKEATARGFSQQDSNFLATLSENERLVAQRMLELAEGAVENKRALAGTRPIDVAGENLIKKYKPILELKRELGKEVDDVARTLRGETLDTTRLFDALDESLNELAITGAPGEWDFSKSVFKNVPAVQKQLANAFDDIYKLDNDAYQTHIFKKSIDEIVEYGTTGEGLKGASSTVLKRLRREADTLLDTTFPTYNEANTKFAEIRNLTELAEDVFGKDLNTERAANTIRMVFGNSQKRGTVKNFLSTLDSTAVKYKVQTGDNLLDQALVAEILEDIYGTQAITGFRGQIERAIRTTKNVADLLRNPVRGIANMAGDIAETVSRQRPVDREAFLKALFNNTLEI